MLDNICDQNNSFELSTREDRFKFLMGHSDEAIINCIAKYKSLYLLCEKEIKMCNQVLDHSSILC